MLTGETQGQREGTMDGRQPVQAGTETDGWCKGMGQGGENSTRKGDWLGNVTDERDSLKSDRKLEYIFIPLPIFQIFFVVQKLYSHNRPRRPSKLTAQQRWPSHSGILTLRTLSRPDPWQTANPLKSPKDGKFPTFCAFLLHSLLKQIFWSDLFLRGCPSLTPYDQEITQPLPNPQSKTCSRQV